MNKSLDNVEYNSFISTSLDKNVAQGNFSKGRLYEINLPKGTKYIPMDSIDGFSGMYTESEAEILLPPSSFKVLNKEQQGKTEVVNVEAEEKEDFLEIIKETLDRRKDELIEKGMCSEVEFEETLKYLNEKQKNKEQGEKSSLLGSAVEATKETVKTSGINKQIQNLKSFDKERNKEETGMEK